LPNTALKSPSRNNKFGTGGGIYMILISKYIQLPATGPRFLKNFALLIGTDNFALSAFLPKKEKHYIEKKLRIIFLVLLMKRLARGDICSELFPACSREERGAK
jgi:ABC-type transporter lipoprotein component MlaA